MQQSNYVEAEEAYRRALILAPDNNKMCNLGICLMKQGRIGEAKDTLRRVKPAVADGPRGVDSHLKAYERAQQMLRDLESEMMNKGGVDRVEQSKLFDAFLGSSAIWQPQPCKETRSFAPLSSAKEVPMPSHAFADENANSNIIANRLPLSKSMINPLNIDAQPFYSSKIAERLKRTRSNSLIEQGSKSVAKSGESWADFLPDSKDFEDAIIAAVLGGESEGGGGGGVAQKKVEKRLKVFQDITLSLSPSPKPKA